MLAYKDYYSFGMPMPDRNQEGAYRYGYQGEFAETDPETGMPAFELRLWDARIGRWLTTDPYGQHYSPYMGMGNNPISRVDPDGGCDDPPCVVNGGTLPEVVITSSGGGGSTGAGYIPFQHTFAGTFDQWSQQHGQAFSSTDRDLAALQWQVSYGKESYDWNIASENAFRGQLLAQHLMNVGRTVENLSVVVGLGGFKPVRYTAPRPKFQGLTSNDLKVIAVNNTLIPKNALSLKMNPKIKALDFYKMMNPNFRGLNGAGGHGFTSPNGIKWSLYSGGNTNATGWNIKGLTPNRQHIFMRFNK